MKQARKLWKHWARLPEAQQVRIESSLTLVEFQKWLETNLPEKFSSVGAIKALYASRKKRNYIGKYDTDTFELTLIKDKSVTFLNYVPPLVAGRFKDTSAVLIIELTVGIKRPYWFWKLTRMFLCLFLAGFIFIPFLGMMLEGIPISEMVIIGTFFILAFPIVALVLFSIFDFIPLELVRRTQKHTINILLDEFKAT